MEWEAFNLNESLQENIKSLYKEPTEIQQKVLVYTTAKVDLLIQARTGEGKTLCYGIPIINYLLNCYSRLEKIDTRLSPVALILVPTRELGIQVKNHLEKVILDQETNKNYYNIKIANVLGGFAKPKQIKVLNKLSPEIIIATPGRLWEIIENEESPLLEKLNGLKFLVIDEADRMTEKGHFVELKNIIEHVYNRIELKKNNGDNEKGKKRINTIQSDITMEEDKEENEKLAKKLKVDVDDIETIDPLELLSDEANFDEEIDIDKVYQNEEEEEEEEDNNLEIDEDKDDNYNEEYDEDYDQMNNEEEEEENEEAEEEDRKNIVDYKRIYKEKQKEISKIELNPYISMRTILCSATIDQIHQESQNKKSNKKQKQKQSSLSSEDQHFQKLIRNLKFYNKLIYLKLKNQKSNLTTSTETSKDRGNHQQQKPQLNKEESDSTIQILPEKLEIDCYKCDPSTRDYYLFHILKENEKKRIIIFTNSISHTKKLYSIFSYFNELKCTVLHSKMLQNVRIKNLDRFSSNQINILFCTDIGARGLDIPFVDLVIHYHVPQKTETFIHRSGRTARANRSGKVTSLITQKELMLYKKVMIDLHYNQFAMKTLNIVQLEKIKSLFEYAKQIERETFQIKKANREKQWYKKTAEQCDMLVDDENDNRDDDEDNDVREAKAEEKLLNKKRNLMSKEKLNQKKIYTKINESSIKRTSFLTPDLVKKWNLLMNESNLKNENLTQALYNAHNDARSIRFKEKPKKKRYQRRRNKNQK